MVEFSWLILLYSLPAKQAAARLSLWRSLKKIGAVPLKTSAYLLPQSPENDESLSWLAQKVRQEGGETTLLRVAQVDKLTHEEVIELFHKARTEEYHEILREAQALKPAKGQKKPTDSALLEKLTTRFQAVRKVDFFDCPAGKQTREALEKLATPAGSPAPGSKVRAADFQGRTWQTRPRPELDRVASAWLIRRHVDAKATFVFSPEPKAFPGAVTFDMVNADFGHEGDHCTFESLLHRFSLRAPGLADIAKIVHDSDLGDGRHGTSEGEGLLAVLRGWGRLGVPDEEILRRGGEILDGLLKAKT